MISKKLQKFLKFQAAHKHYEVYESILMIPKRFQRFLEFLQKQISRNLLILEDFKELKDFNQGRHLIMEMSCFSIQMQN